MIVQNSTKLPSFLSFRLFELALLLKMKTQKRRKFLNLWKRQKFCRFLKDSTLIWQIYDFKALNLSKTKRN